MTYTVSWSVDADLKDTDDPSEAVDYALERIGQSPVDDATQPGASDHQDDERIDYAAYAPDPEAAARGLAILERWGADDRDDPKF